MPGKKPLLKHQISGLRHLDPTVYIFNTVNNKTKKQ